MWKTTYCLFVPLSSSSVDINIRMDLCREKKKKMARILRAVGQRIPGMILIALLIIGFVGPPFFPGFYWFFVLSVHVFLITNAVRLAVGLVITAVKTKAHTRMDWKKEIKELEILSVAKGSPEVNSRQYKSSEIVHLIIVPNYKEDMETLMETLDTLAYHSRASTDYAVILAMEQGEKDSDKKAEKLISHFSGKFMELRYTIHPSGIPGEARGKSSNVAWASIYYHDHWLDKKKSGNYLITVMDADTHLTEKYFDCITYRYLSEKTDRVLFAPTLIFDRNSNDVPFFVRLADICWDTGPEAIGEDCHMALKCWTTSRMNLCMIPIYIPASCSNVQANSWLGSCNARFQQAKRHLWAALDFGYTASALITKKCWTANFWKSLLCIYILFEIFFQPYFGFFQFFGQFVYPESALSPIGKFVLDCTTYIRLALIPSAVVVAFAYERYHYVASYYRASILQNVENLKVEQATRDIEAENVEQIKLKIYNSFGQSQVAFRRWYQIFDWTGFPIALIFYYVIPAINAMIGHLFTNEYDYKVSIKPTTRSISKPSAAPPVGPNTVVTTSEMSEEQAIHSPNNHDSSENINMDLKNRFNYHHSPHDGGICVEYELSGTNYSQKMLSAEAKTTMLPSEGGNAPT
jgi:hypothetical protein